MAKQRMLTAGKGYQELDAFFKETGVKRLLLVCGASLDRLEIGGYFDALEAQTGIAVSKFSGFAPNPDYESVVKGVEHFRNGKYDMIVAAGGGSAMDVAKCIKLFANMDPENSYLSQSIIPNDIELLAIPTTAGSGSEATRFAVIYRNGEKQSVAHESCIPSAVLLDPSCLSSLPDYNKKVSMLDALCHAAESFWSVNSTEESKAYSKMALETILSNWEPYLKGNYNSGEKILYAANTAGKAINITQTTAGHAMCYKLTSLYGIAHGHAAALCVSKLWPYMVSHLEKCADARGKDYLKAMFQELASVMGYTSTDCAIAGFEKMLDAIGLSTPMPHQPGDFELLRASVNQVRLKNNPVMLDTDAIDMLYHQILVG